MAQSTNIETWLKKANKSWKKEAAAGKSLGANDIDDGFYIVRWLKGLIEKGDSGLRLKITTKVLDGESKDGVDYTGKKIVKSDGLEGDQSLQYLAKMLSRLGIDPEECDLTDLPEILVELNESKPVMKIQVKTKGDFQNVYINKLVEDYEDEDGEDEEDEEEDAKSKKGKKTAPKNSSKKPSKKDEEDEDEDEDEDEEDGEDEEEEEEEKPKPESKPKAKPEPKKTAKSKAKAKEEDEDEDEEDEDEDEEEGTLSVGSIVEFKHKGEILSGKVKEFNAKEAKVRVVQGGKGVVMVVAVDKLTLLDSDDD